MQGDVSESKYFVMLLCLFRVWLGVRQRLFGVSCSTRRGLSGGMRGAVCSLSKKKFVFLPGALTTQGRAD